MKAAAFEEYDFYFYYINDVVKIMKEYAKQNKTKYRNYFKPLWAVSENDGFDIGDEVNREKKSYGENLKTKIETWTK